MSACFTGWGKRVVTALLILTLHLNTFAQNEKLAPELDVTYGLQSNTIKSVKIDLKGRFWIGTDYGLDIHNDNTFAQKKIVASVGHKSIQAIEFLDSLVFIGTSYEGLFVFNQFTGNLYKYYGSGIINQIIKFKIFGKQVFVLCRTGPYLWSHGVLNPLPLTSAIKSDFLIDMFQYANNQYGLAYPCRQIVKFSSNAFEENCNDLFFKKNKKLYQENYTSSLYYNNKLFLGSGGKSQSLLVIEKNKPPLSLDFLKSLGVGYMVWDIARQKDKLILAVGDTISDKKGLLCILNADYSYISVKAADYITCMALDSINNTLVYGTMNNGLFLESGIAGSAMIDKPTECTVIANDKNLFIYTDDYVEKFITSGYRPSLQTHKKNKITDIISAMNLTGDTLVYANAGYIKVFNANTLNPLCTLPVTQPESSSGSIAAVERINNTIFCFYINGMVWRYSLITKQGNAISKVTSHNPEVFKQNDQIIFLNKGEAFFIVSEKDGYPLACKDSSIRFINDFAISHDTVYALFKDELKEYKIDYKLRSLILLKSFSTRFTLADVIGIRWILSKDNRIYILNDNGIMAMSAAITPTRYFYFGSYNQIKKPIIVGDSLLISTNNSLTKFSFSEIEKQRAHFDVKDVSIDCPQSVYENIGFQVNVNLADYFMQDHSLKTLEIWSNGKLQLTKYTKFSDFNFNEGLKYGDYKLVLKMENTLVTKNLSITLPLNRNPWFFGAILLATIIIFLFVIKSNIDKRRLKKRLLENKLQNLKQNLNPHFVYNSMNLISSMILEEKYDEALQVVSDFSRLQRTYLETNNKEQISVAEELEFLEYYLKLQQKRFHEDSEFSFTVTINPAINIHEVMVPPLILQPIAENAIKYGVLGSNAVTRMLRIDVAAGQNCIMVALEDNGKEVDLSYHGLGMGQKLVQERIDLFNVSHHTNIKIVFDKPPVYSSSGYRVELEIPV